MLSGLRWAVKAHTEMRRWEYVIVIVIYLTLPPEMSHMDTFYDFAA